jgi:hypothetical protein
VISGSRCMAFRRDLRLRIFTDFSLWILPTIHPSPLFTDHTRMTFSSSCNNIFLPILYVFSKARRQAGMVRDTRDGHVWIFLGAVGEEIQEGPG